MRHGLLRRVDTAPTPGCEVEQNSVIDQKSLRSTGHDNRYLKQFDEIVDRLARLSGAQVKKRTQEEILSGPDALECLRELILHREQLGRLFSPRTGQIGLRVNCPETGCGLADKGGVKNRYSKDLVVFECPDHGIFSLNILDDQDRGKVGLNTPMRNLLRNRLFQLDVEADWTQIIGPDYAGFYQEQLLWRPISAMETAKVPIIL